MSSYYKMGVGTGVVVGASIWQTPGGIQSEMDRINDDFILFQSEIYRTLQDDGYPAKNSQSPTVKLFERVWQPFFERWKLFYLQNRGWWRNFWWNHAPEAEQFQTQLVIIRNVFKGLGVDVKSPEPIAFGPSLLFDPHENAIDRTIRDAEKARSSIVNALGWVVPVAIGTIAVVVIKSRTK